MTTRSLSRRQRPFGDGVFRRGEAFGCRRRRRRPSVHPWRAADASGGVVEAARDPSHHYSGCPPVTRSHAHARAVPFNFMRRRRLISTGALLSDSGLFELVASRLGSSAGLLLSGELRGRQHTAVWRCHGVTRSCTPAAAARHCALLVPAASARATRCRHAAWPSTSTAPCAPAPQRLVYGGSFVLC